MRKKRKILTSLKLPAPLKEKFLAMRDNSDQAILEVLHGRINDAKRNKILLKAGLTQFRLAKEKAKNIRGTGKDFLPKSLSLRYCIK